MFSQRLTLNLAVQNPTKEQLVIRVVPGSKSPRFIFCTCPPHLPIDIGVFECERYVHSLFELSTLGTQSRPIDKDVEVCSDSKSSVPFDAGGGTEAVRSSSKPQSSKTLTPPLVDQSPHFQTRFQNPRFFSQFSEIRSDSDSAQGEELPVGFGENGDSQPDNLATGNGDGDEKGSEGGYVELRKGEEVYEIDLQQLESVLSLLQSSADGSLESSFDALNLTLHPEFVVKLVETPLVLVENLIRFIKWALKEKPEFRVTTNVLDALVRSTCSSLVRKRDVNFLWDLVKEIGEKENTQLNMEILNDLISAFSKLGKGKAAFEVFNKFACFGCVPNADSYYFTIEALCRRSFFVWAQSVCGKMLDAGALPDGERVGRIISWFCKGKNAKDAHLVYLSVKVKKQDLPRSPVNLLINSLCREDC